MMGIKKKRGMKKQTKIVSKRTSSAPNTTKKETQHYCCVSFF
jgi:hypothetical protein